MKPPSHLLALLLLALVMYSGMPRPDLIISWSKDSTENRLSVRAPFETRGRIFTPEGAMQVSSFLGTWVTTGLGSQSRLTLEPDGTLILEDYVSGLVRRGTWFLRGNEVWVDLEEIA